jgi:hypothetical protein
MCYNLFVEYTRKQTNNNNNNIDNEKSTSPKFNCCGFQDSLLEKKKNIYLNNKLVAKKNGLFFFSINCEKNIKKKNFCCKNCNEIKKKIIIEKKKENELKFENIY